jgi:hypothetical protein
MGTVAITFRALENWPRAMTRTRKRSPFDSSYQQTLNLIDNELWKTGTRAAVVQLAMEPRDIRNDGMPRSDARPPKHPGVILSFEKSVGGKRVPLSFPCDAFTDWQANLRAIGLALEALRKVDRYGVTSMAEQYRGWAQLPGPIVTPVKMTFEQAAEFLFRFCGMNATPHDICGRRDVFEGGYRNAVKKLHPDANGGQELQDWHTLQQAAEVLKKHHGIG